MAEKSKSGTGTKVFGANMAVNFRAPKLSTSWEIKDVIKKGDYDNVLLYSYTMSQQEIVDIRRCFGEVTHMFTFGRNTAASVMEIYFLVFLYEKCSSSNKDSSRKAATLTTLTDLYENARVYKKRARLQITVGDDSVNGFLVKMAVNKVDPTSKMAILSLSFIMDQEV